MSPERHVDIQRLGSSTYLRCSQCAWQLRVPYFTLQERLAPEALGAYEAHDCASYKRVSGKAAPVASSERRHG